MGREQLGVGGAEQGAVREAEVGELGVAEGLADHVHVPGRVDRADVGKLGRRSGPGSRRRTCGRPATRASNPAAGRRRRDRVSKYRSRPAPSSAADRGGAGHPGGSKPTRSKCWQESTASGPPRSGRQSTPDTPGPPGLTSERTDLLARSPDAGRGPCAIVGPSGWPESRGTCTVAHW